MQYVKDFSDGFEFWAGAKDKVNTIIKIDNDAYDEMLEYIENYFDGIDETPTETEINDFVWFELSCIEVCNDAADGGVEYVFGLEDDLIYEFEEEIDEGNASFIF